MFDELEQHFYNRVGTIGSEFDPNFKVANPLSVKPSRGSAFLAPCNGEGCKPKAAGRAVTIAGKAIAHHLRAGSLGH